MKLIQDIMKNCPCYKYNRNPDLISDAATRKKYTDFHKNGPKALMLHSVGCPQPKATVFVKIFGKSDYDSASVHAFIDAEDGSVHQTLPWNYRAWHCGGSANNTHVGVEMCEPDCITYTGGSTFKVSDKARALKQIQTTYKAAVELFAYLCKKYDINPMKGIVSHKEGHDKGIASNHGDPEHLWKGAGSGYTMDGFRKDVKAAMNGDTKLQATALKKLSNEKVVEKVGPLFTADQKKSGILASVSMAQFLLESNYGTSELAQRANNCFGMKCSLSGNTWDGSAWDGKSIYTKQTKEQDANGKECTVKADFRKYACAEDSITDHSAYLLGAKTGSKLRYTGLKGCTDYKKAVTIIKNGGYATDTAYVDKICAIIKKWNLTQYDVKKTDTSKEETTFKTYVVKVDVSNLNIRKGPGTNYAKTGKYTGKGKFTIIEESNGKGASKWGRLKSGAGWISLDYAKKV